MDILSIGECMAELAPAEKPGDYRLGFAGDTYNTAWYIARTAPSIHVGYFTAVGGDAISQQMIEAIAGSGIDHRFVRTISDETAGLYLISLNNGERSFSYWRSQSAARKLADDKALLADALAQASMIYFSGITLAILGATGRQTLLDALVVARSNGKRVAFDPNLRPRLWQSTDEMTETIMQGAAVCDIALPSFEDEADWFNDADPAATAQRYTDVGATIVVVKNGDGPVLYCHDGVTASVDVSPVDNVVDTTAAGDSFNAALLAGIHADQPIEQSVESACRLASKVVQAKGALVPITADG